MEHSRFRLKQSLKARSESWLIRNVVFPVWIRRDHPRYLKYRYEFDRTQFLAKADLEALQIARLRKLLRHAKDRCPFYAENLDRAEIVPEELTSLGQFARLPILTKRDIQNYGATLQAKDFPEKKRGKNQTGGSTGSPLQFYVDMERFDSRKASTLRHDLWAGLRPGDWRISLWGSRLDQARAESWWDELRNNLLHRIVALNTSKVTEKDWSRLIRDVRRLKPRAMVAYTQAAVAFARYLREQKIDIQIDSIITTAEMLLPGQRQFLEETFGGKVFNRYGCREVSVIASECEFHRGMHVNADALLVEIVPDTSIPGKSGRILVTDLLNYSMPLIRYEIGDVGQWEENQDCPCGRQLPLLAEVHGRSTDFLVLSDGRQISGPALTLVVSDMTDVQQVQFVQRTPSLIVLRVVAGKKYGMATERELRRRLEPYFERGAQLEVELTSSIASEISGKYRFVIRENVEPNLGHST